MLMTLNKLNLTALKFNIEVASIVENISQPLLDCFGITNFGFVKLFADGTMLRVSADQDWTKKYFDYQFYNDTHFYNFETLAENAPEIRIITNQPTVDHYKALYEHNIWNILTQYERLADHIEIAFFATTTENTEIINFYANHIATLQNFIQYFKKEADSLLNVTDPSVLISTELKLRYNIIQENQKINQFLKTICGDLDEKKLNFTSREADCIRQLILGKTAKEIAVALKISHRTVEAHFNNIKRKAGCKKLSQLIKLVLEQKN